MVEPCSAAPRPMPYRTAPLGHARFMTISHNVCLPIGEVCDSGPNRETSLMISSSLSDTSSSHGDSIDLQARLSENQFSRNHPAIKASAPRGIKERLST
jgi:hypothetical protein